MHHTNSLSRSMMFIHETLLRIWSKIIGQSITLAYYLKVWHSSMKQNQWTMKYRSLYSTFIMRSIFVSYWLHPLNIQEIGQNHWTMKYMSCWPTFILHSKVRSHCWIIPKYDVHPSNRLQDIRQNHWTKKYRSPWPSFYLIPKVMPHWLIIPKDKVDPSNSLQDTWQLRWAVKYR